MSDYIEQQKAIRWVKTECNPYGKPTLDFESGKKVIEHLEQMPSANVVPYSIESDGTLIITVPKGTKVGRVLVEEEGTQWGWLYYAD